jgi:hypothetical protein
MVLRRSALGSYESQGQVLANADETQELNIEAEDFYGRLVFSLPRKHHLLSDDGTLSFKIGVKASTTSMTFQGHLFGDFQKVRRQGIVDGEHALIND